MAAAAGVSEKTVRRIWRAHGLKPHVVRSFKLSRDPQFEEKVRDVVGLYLSPPGHAVVLSCDEKSQIQALERSQPMLPFNTGHVATQTHDYARHGTTTLFAALNVATGEVIGECMPRHTHKEWIRFLKLIDGIIPARLAVHLICDNYATHKHPSVRAWIERHPRFRLHFTPTSASWLNQVERFFRDLDTHAIQRGSFKHVRAVIKAIKAYLAAHNGAPKAYIWTAEAKDILEKVKRAWAALERSRRKGTATSAAAH
jgi:transposase